MERVDQVNSDAYFLARVSRVVLFGSYLRPELDRLGDIDIAVELRPKESDYQRVREATERRLADLADRGRRVAGLLARESWWGGGVAFPEGAESRDQPARLRRREGTHRCGPSPGDLPGCKATEEQAEEEIDPDAPKRGVVLTVAATRRRTATSFVLPGKVDSQSPQWAAQRNRTPPIIPDPGREPVSRNVRIARTRGGRQAGGVAERPEIGPLCNVPACAFPYAELAF